MSGAHPVVLDIDYPEHPLNRLTTALRPFVALPILILLVVGVGRWHLRVIGYAFALVTDAYPPFRLGP